MKISNVVGAIAVLALAAGVGYGATALPAAQTQGERIAATVQSGRTNLVCTGGVGRLIAQGTPVNEQDEELRSVVGGQIQAAPSTADGANVGDLVAGSLWKTLGSSAKDVELSNSVFAAKLGTKARIAGSELIGALQVDTSIAGDAAIAAHSTHRAKAGDLRGLATAACTWQANSAWFVGFSAGVGSSNELVLVNPGENPLSVSLSAYTSLGRTSLGAAGELTVGARSSKTLKLDGLIPDDPSVALHVESATGFFGAHLQSSLLEGLTARGITVVKSSEVGKQVYIPGLHLPAAKGAAQQNPLPGQQAPDSQLADESYAATLRIVNPSSRVQTVRAELIDGEGNLQVLPGGEAITLAAGAVLDLSLDGFGAGDYTVKLQSEGVITGAVRMTSSAGSAGSDVTWIAAQPSANAGAASFTADAAHAVFSVDPTALNNASSGQASAGSGQEPAGAAATVTWQAFDVAGKELKNGELEVKGTAALDLPAGTAFVRYSSDAEDLYAGLMTSVAIGSSSGVEWVPFTPLADSASSVRIALTN